jgi:ketosteroid isomerase-like protein
MKAKDEVKAIIKQFFKAMDTQDLETIKKLIPKTNTTIHIGTDKGEIWKGWQMLSNATEEQFEELEYYKANIRDLTVNVSENDDIAWYHHKLDAKIKSCGNITRWKDARFTGVLQNIDGQWVMAQTHVSLPK